MKARYMQLDVFPARRGGGNPLGCVLDATGWSDADMQTFATWTDLVETTFVLPATTAQADYRLRIFTPQREIAFAGHPTIGSAHALLEAGLVRAHDGRLVQECQAGLLPIVVEHGFTDGNDADRRLLVRAPQAQLLREGADATLSQILEGVVLGVLPPAFIEGGRRWWVAEFASDAQLRAWRPDHAAIAALARDTDSLGLCAFARSEGNGYELVVRAFPAGVGIVEDPASGAANGLIAAWIAMREPEGPLALGYRVSQGREIGKDAEILVRIDDSGIWVGGATRTIVDGVVAWRNPD